MFEILTHSQKLALVNSLSTMSFRAGEKIVNEGDPGDLFYIIKDGTVSCKKADFEIRQMTKGDYFGEQSLLYNCERTASVFAVDDVKCVGISREKLTKALGSQLQQIIYQNSKRIAIEKDSILSQLSTDQIEKLLKCLTVTTYHNRDTVIPKNIPKGSCLLVVLKGSLSISNGAVIGELFTCVDVENLIKPMNELYNDDILAYGDCDVAMISREEFVACLGGEFEQIKIQNEAISVLKRVQVLRGLSSDKLVALVKSLKIQIYQASEIIVEQNEPGDAFYIIKSGKVGATKDGIKTRTINKLDYFGERSVLFNENRTASVIALEDVECWVLHKLDFLAVIDENIRNQLIKRIDLQDDQITLKDLRAVKLLGKGMFGLVHLVVHKDQNRLYALKTIERRKIQKFDLQENLILERNILLQIDHNLILKLVKTFKDEHRVYLLTEYVRGMDLFDVLRKMNEVSNENAKFFICCLVVILEHLHERDIIYRDLKPENIMIDEDGYPKLIDFGISKFVRDRTYTLVGTPHYMAPEIILGKGYGKETDFWSVGVMLYEFLCGGVPFGNDWEDPYMIYQYILQGNLDFPKFVHKLIDAKLLISQLLSKNPETRTGGSIDNLKNHAWFQGFE